MPNQVKIENSTMGIVTASAIMFALAGAVWTASEKFQTRDSMKTDGSQYFATKEELRDLQNSMKVEFDALRKENKSLSENMSKESKEQRNILDSVRDNTTKIMTVIEIMQRNQYQKQQK